MREESKSYAREAMDIVEHAAHKIGSRLPGSDGEIKFHQYMGDKLRDIGIEPKTEEFAVSPFRYRRSVLCRLVRRDPEHRRHYRPGLRL